MTDFVTYNGNQYDPAKLNQSKGEGAKATVVLDQLYNYSEAPKSSAVTTIIVTPFQDGFSVIVKPVGDQMFPAAVHIVSKMILKKIKHDPNAKYVETDVQPERPAFRQERPQNNWNNRSSSGGYRRDEVPVTGNFNKTPRSAISNTSSGNFTRTKPQSSATRSYIPGRGMTGPITPIDESLLQPNRTLRHQTPR